MRLLIDKYYPPVRRRDWRDEDLVSDSIDESVSCVSTLKLRWSEDALREAYDASELNMVSSAARVCCTPRFVGARTFLIAQQRSRRPPPMYWYRGCCLNMSF